MGREGLIADARTAAADALMAGFARRTGLDGPAGRGRRYLWTDAFAVFACL